MGGTPTNEGAGPAPGTDRVMTIDRGGAAASWGEFGGTFDWQGFLEANRPSDGPQASQLQRDRLKLVDRLLADLEAWSSQHGIADIWMGDEGTFRKRLSYTAHGCAT